MEEYKIVYKLHPDTKKFKPLVWQEWKDKEFTKEQVEFNKEHFTFIEVIVPLQGEMK